MCNLLKKVFIFFHLFSFIFIFEAQANRKYWNSSIPKKSKFLRESSIDSRVRFWVKIYSQYLTTQGVFHDVNNPNIIYGEIDISDIYENSVLNYRSKLKLAKIKIENQRKILISKYKIKDSKKIRLQMGLKDRMQQAIYNAGLYLPMMEQIFKNKNLPPELTRLVYVESSFNIKAQSKVGASGLWQIMPSVGRAEGYLQKYYDKRNHPYYSTILAANMLKKNFDSLKNWPLAITAYNHGLTGVRRMIQKADSNQIYDLIESLDKTKSWGFASENFYACFLAVLQVEKKANFYFGENILQSKPMSVSRIYLKKETPQLKILNIFGGSYSRFVFYNPHLNHKQIKDKKYFPQGIPLVLPATTKL